MSEARGLVERNKCKIITRDGDRIRLVPKRA
jgi:hypothetical protein